MPVVVEMIWATLLAGADLHTSDTGCYQSLQSSPHQVNSYTQKTFELLVREFRAAKCEVLHASANQITFATGKLSYEEALHHFRGLRESLLADPVFLQMHPALDEDQGICVCYEGRAAQEEHDRCRLKKIVTVDAVWKWSSSSHMCGSVEDFRS